MNKVFQMSLITSVLVTSILAQEDVYGELNMEGTDQKYSITAFPGSSIKVSQNSNSRGVVTVKPGTSMQIQDRITLENTGVIYIDPKTEPVQKELMGYYEYTDQDSQPVYATEAGLSDPSGKTFYSIDQTTGEVTQIITPSSITISKTSENQYGGAVYGAGTINMPYANGAAMMSITENSIQAFDGTEFSAVEARDYYLYDATMAPDGGSPRYNATIYSKTSAASAPSDSDYVSPYMNNGNLIQGFAKYSFAKNQAQLDSFKQRINSGAEGRIVGGEAHFTKGSFGLSQDNTSFTDTALGAIGEQNKFLLDTQPAMWTSEWMKNLPTITRTNADSSKVETFNLATVSGEDLSVEGVTAYVNSFGLFPDSVELDSSGTAAFELLLEKNDADAVKIGDSVTITADKDGTISTNLHSIGASDNNRIVFDDTDDNKTITFSGNNSLLKGDITFSVNTVITGGNSLPSNKVGVDSNKNIKFDVAAAQGKQKEDGPKIYEGTTLTISKDASITIAEGTVLNVLGQLVLRDAQN